MLITFYFTVFWFVRELSPRVPSVRYFSYNCQDTFLYDFCKKIVWVQGTKISISAVAKSCLSGGINF